MTLMMGNVNCLRALQGVEEVVTTKRSWQDRISNTSENSTRSCRGLWRPSLIDPSDIWALQGCRLTPIHVKRKYLKG